MSKARDPLGKRALFSDVRTEPKPQPQSRTPERKRGAFDVTVHCSACDAQTTLSAPAFILQQFPLWAWIPGRKHSHLMRCPACNHIAWHAVSLAG